MYRNILVVDDEEVMCESLAAWLREDGYNVDTAGSGRQAIEKARAKDYAICFVDLKMPGGLDGLETMREIRKLRPEAAIIIITAYATVDTAVAAIKQGAEEYVVKPCNPREISLMVSRILKMKRLERENAILRAKLAQRHRFEDFLSQSPRMAEIIDLCRQIANLPSTVLLRGESGTGKGLLARAIHNASNRASRPFVSVSCAALAETLLESELFGHEKGSFTGAVETARGKFEIADGGTIFLDEIGDISPKLQTDLLRVLEDKRFYRVGGAQEIVVDVRVIAATNTDLKKAVQEGKFRDDLYYRLNVIDIVIPPLRERREDIPLLARHFADRRSHELGKEILGISDAAMKVLLDYDWPGNVRELENAIERAIVTCSGSELGEKDFAFLKRDDRTPWPLPAGMTLEEMEKQAIAAALERHRGNIKETAAALGIDRSTLYDKIKRYGIPRGA
ncbi:MAG TPA: sigma-54 dependent transcriptional regulator [Bryobacteraceae bacterium]|nr:sigma-54 dependent transcriptional regulator [Bryobacteraceae bacterium]HPU72298.1 sigma-54 dependent transcriptional regulator [Bryobacteraceae bacterium]